MYWWQKAVFYQIYPTAFKDSNGDGIGDIRGIIDKIDYLVDLGIDAVWISPFYQSPWTDGGYDISDYCSPNENMGSMNDVEELINSLHEKNIKVVFDMVMNHTSIEHQWFIDSEKKVNGKDDWYIWKKGKGNNPPNNWKSSTGGRGWHYSSIRKEWYYASFLPFQPDLNYRNPEVKKKMFDQVRFWLDKGVDGFRLDIFNMIMKDNQFLDNPFSFKPFPSEEDSDGFFQKTVYTINHKDNFVLAEELRQVLDTHSEREKFLIGEVFGSHEILKSYIGNSRNRLHTAFQFDQLNFKFSADFFGEKITTYKHHYSNPLIPTLVFGNHDRKRYIVRVNNNLEKVKLIALYQLTARGIPFIYNGEEIGMPHSYLPTKTALDPIAKKYSFVPKFLRKLIPIDINRDGCRTPICWDDSTMAGFTDSNKSYLPIGDYKNNGINVQSQLKEENSLLNTYKKLIKLRKTYISLHTGDIKLISTEDNILVYERVKENEKTRVIINFSKDSKIIKIDTGIELIWGLSNTVKEQNMLNVSGFGGAILKIN